MTKKNDQSVTISELREIVRRFAEERGWEIYHQPKNLAASISIEAAELLEIFQWLTPEESANIADDPEKKRAAGEEIADVLSYLLALCNRLEIDLTDVFLKKTAKNAIKYPPEAFFGLYGYDDPKRKKD